MDSVPPQHEETHGQIFPDLVSDGPVVQEPNTRHKRTVSGNILSKLSFLRASAEDIDKGAYSAEFLPGDDQTTPKKASRAMAVVQQQRTRKRKGSLRKAALLGRGAQREKKENKATIESNRRFDLGFDGNIESPSNESQLATFGLGLLDAIPKASSEKPISRATNLVLHPIRTFPMGHDDHMVTSPTSISATSPTLTYTSTTDEDEVLNIAPHSALVRSAPSSHFPVITSSLTRRRSSQKPQSPLSLSGLVTTPIPDPDGDWDYAETEWWGWIILVVTWVVFVTGMGSCLGVWSWAWDVGETPYAPPELENDDTLPIVGYYPALIILTAVMAWVWVVVAWVGMKYFRHAKISGD
ncbi:hypothetical protein BJ878DRAFT_518066 [Calycina marina]|uniref:Uncharacterized protein n=1 Tax=Calycina marina TaxID=1763456 RepID=A0A9P7YXW6_9HELO|nr:hypothetical protein BJ878DRAFT_518066 [Calycina marina]